MPTYRVTIDGQLYTVDIPDPTARPVQAVVDGYLFEVAVEDDNRSIKVAARCRSTCG